MKIEYVIEPERKSITLPALYQNLATPDLIVFFISACVGLIVEKPVGSSNFKIGGTNTFNDGCITGQWKRLPKNSSVTFIQED